MAETKVLKKAVLLDGDSFTTSHLSSIEARIAAILAATGGSKIVSFGPGQFYKVDFEKMASAIAALNATLGSKDGRLTHEDLRRSADFITPLDTKTASAIVGRLPSYTPDLFHPGATWPTKGVMPGIGVVVGDTGSGKTTFLVDKAGVEVLIRYGEPLEFIDSRQNVIHASSLVEAVSLAILISFYGVNVAIDSLRSLVYGLSGNAMEGGMVASLFDVLTQFNNLVADFGVVILVAINPMLADQTKADRLFVRIAASVSGAYHIVDGGPRAQTFRLDSGRMWGATASARPADPVVEGPSYGGVYAQLGRLSDESTRDAMAAGFAATPSVETQETTRLAAPFTIL